MVASGAPCVCGASKAPPPALLDRGHLHSNVAKHVRMDNLRGTLSKLYIRQPIFDLEK